MDDLPIDLQNLILDYKSQLEHTEKMAPVLEIIREYFRIYCRRSWEGLTPLDYNQSYKNWLFAKCLRF